MTAAGSAWAAANTKFSSDSHWRGADGAVSIDLGGGRTVFLFGDTYWDVAGNLPNRVGCRFIHNTVALADNYDLSAATVTFYTGTSGGQPSEFFANQGSYWYWPGSGIRVDNTLVIMLNRAVDLIGTDTVLGVDAWVVTNPDSAPSAWTMTLVPTPSGNILAGPKVAYPFRDDGVNFVYGYGFSSYDPFLRQSGYVLRWKREDFKAGRLMNPTWWRGPFGYADAPFTVGSYPYTPSAPSPIAYPATSEPRFRASDSKWLMAKANGITNVPLAYQTNSTLESGWGAFTNFYTPPEVSFPQAVIYYGNQHPWGTWSGKAATDLLCSYSIQNFAQNINTDMTQYFPKFVQATGLS